MTSVDYLVKEVSAILGPLKTEPMQDLLLVDAINKAKEMHKQEIIDAVGVGSQFDRNYLYGYHDKAEQYYQETFEGVSNTNQLPKQETLYTEEQVREAIDMTRHIRFVTYSDDEIIQSLKQPKQ